MLQSKLNQITKNNKHTKKKIFSRGFKQAADLLEEDLFTQELFATEDEPTLSIQIGNGYGPRTIDFTGVICNLHKESKEKKYYFI